MGEAERIGEGSVQIGGGVENDCWGDAVAAARRPLRPRESMISQWESGEDQPVGEGAVKTFQQESMISQWAERVKGGWPG